MCVICFVLFCKNYEYSTRPFIFFNLDKHSLSVLSIFVSVCVCDTVIKFSLVFNLQPFPPMVPVYSVSSTLTIQTNFRHSEHDTYSARASI